MSMQGQLEIFTWKTRENLLLIRGWANLGGYWEEDAFIVKTNGFNGETWLDRSGNFHSDQLKVTEKYLLLNSHTMQYEATIDDPEIFTRPWKIQMILYKRVGKDSELQQFKCVEFVEELIYGQWRAKD